MMNPLVRHQGKVALLDRLNVDTDQIIPKQFLKRIERTGFGQFLFYDWRYLPNGEPDAAFEWSDGSAEGASVLLAGENFGCGSSREHAAWALSDFGFRVIIAPSFADIFYNNCFKNGLLPIKLPKETVDELFARAGAAGAGASHGVAGAAGAYTLNVDLVNQTVSDDHGFEASFTVDPFRRQCLLEGLDDIGLTMQLEYQIANYESRRAEAFESAGGTLAGFAGVATVAGAGANVKSGGGSGLGERYELFTNCFLNFN